MGESWDFVPGHPPTTSLHPVGEPWQSDPPPTAFRKPRRASGISAPSSAEKKGDHPKFGKVPLQKLFFQSIQPQLWTQSEEEEEEVQTAEQESKRKDREREVEDRVPSSSVGLEEVKRENEASSRPVGEDTLHMERAALPFDDMCASCVGVCLSSLHYLLLPLTQSPPHFFHPTQSISSPPT